MSLLKDFENKLESLFEGFFAKSFRSGLHPLEIAKKLTRTMEENKMVSVSRVYAPNSYTVFVSPRDKQKLTAFEAGLKLELQEFLKSKAKEEGLTILGTPEIEIVDRKELALGEIKVESKLITPQGLPADRQAGLPDDEDASPEPEELGPSRASLVSLGDPGEVFPLVKDTVTIGRLESNDIVVDDPEVSRVHAEIRRSKGQFVLVDLGSTNGTLVGKRRVQAERLKHKDVLSLGKTDFEFRRE